MYANAQSYIRRIRNPSKRAYADAYWRWLFVDLTTKNGNPNPSPDSSQANISYMAAQGVRMQLDDLAKKHGLSQ